MHTGLDTSRCLSGQALLKLAGRSVLCPWPQPPKHLHKADEAGKDVCESGLSRRVGAGRSPVALPLVWL